VSRITRKELKTDQFALEVEHSITFFGHHKADLAKYGGIAVVLAALIVGYTIYSRRESAQREQALAAAIRVQEAPIGMSGNGGLTFPSQEAKDLEANKVFSELQSKYSGSDEGQIANYYLASIKADQGKLAEAEKMFQQVVEKGDANYASLAKLSLAQINFADGRAAKGEELLRELIANPTVLVSADQATISLARFIGPTKPAEARKLLDELRKRPGAVGQIALTILGELPPQ
jgi:hypothetical protein